MLSSGSASTECAPARLKAALKGVARMLGDQAAGEGWVVDQSDIRDAGEGDADGTKKSEKKKVDEPPRPLAWVEIAGGSFDMGRAVRGPDGDSQVSSRVAVPGFRMSETEVTNGQYLACVKAGACTAPHWDDLTCYMWIEGRWRTGYLPNESRVSNFPVACIDRKQANHSRHGPAAVCRPSRNGNTRRVAAVWCVRSRGAMPVRTATLPS